MFAFRTDSIPPADMKIWWSIHGAILELERLRRKAVHAQILRQQSIAGDEEAMRRYAVDFNVGRDMALMSEKRSMYADFRAFAEQGYIFALTDFREWLDSGFSVPRSTTHRELVDWKLVRAVRTQWNERFPMLKDIRDHTAHMPESRIKQWEREKRTTSKPIETADLQFAPNDNGSSLFAAISTGTGVALTHPKNGLIELPMTEAELRFLADCISQIRTAFASVIRR